MFNPFQNPLDVLARLTGRKSIEDDFNPGYGTGNDVLSGGHTPEDTLQDLGVSVQSVQSWKMGREVVLSFGNSMPFNAEETTAPPVPQKPGIDSLTGLPENAAVVPTGDKITGRPAPTYSFRRLGM